MQANTGNIQFNLLIKANKVTIICLVSTPNLHTFDTPTAFAFPHNIV